MRLCLFLSSLLALTASLVSGTALTYKLNGNEKSCFFTDVQRQNAKVAFYFAVRVGLAAVVAAHNRSWLTLEIQVQSGGQFEIDFEVVGPNDKVILKESKERQGDYVFTAQNAGEYRFCFSNEGYTASDKMVDFEIAVCPSFSHPQLRLRTEQEAGSTSSI